MKKYTGLVFALLCSLALLSTAFAQSGLKNYVWQHNGNRPVYTAPNLNGVPLNLTAPTNGQSYKYDSSTKTFILGTAPAVATVLNHQSVAAGGLADGTDKKIGRAHV